ncbi:hypothetical protein [Bradyrhizobium sp. 150]|uniref:hypothetical protein n=1 Tax=Bradyrhizobium sp. 150 TaxID=2782625 RepID=UPI001FF95D8B|nr:hypothetical protein [Bradyrhizobium sp. 150]MCK1670359.1 hypothetical protein [Bradyrhizobium sp. 150]
MLECSGADDIGGIFTSMCAAIREAERFELSDDVARAAYNLTKSKPTTLLSALPMSRAPFRKIWLEWRGGLTSDMVRPGHRRDPSFAPDPLKQGCLIETDESGQRGTMTFAWIHREKPAMFAGTSHSLANVAPLGTIFNLQEGANVRDDAKSALLRRWSTEKDATAAVLDSILHVRYAREMSDEETRQWMETKVFKDWHRFAGLQSERAALRQLGRHEMPFVSPHALGFFRWCADAAMRSEKMLQTFLSDVVGQSWEPDIEGEAPFAETIIAMMNSRNAIEHRPVDLSGLNKARAKRGRPMFLPYRTTHLRLSQAQTRAFRAGLLTREDAGRHRVRGHFKIRKTGIYWWSPFFRGDPTKPLERQEYNVV